MATNHTSQVSEISETYRATQRISRVTSHLERNDAQVLINLLGPSIVALLGTLGGPDITKPAALAYFIAKICGERGALRRKDIRDILLSKLTIEEAKELCAVLQLPVVTPHRTLNQTIFEMGNNMEMLDRWYGVEDWEVDAFPKPAEGSYKAAASHKLHSHQLNAFRTLRRAISQSHDPILVHMPFGAGKLRLVATAALDLFRSETDDKLIVWFAAGAAMCEEAFVELQEVWKQLGSRDITILQLYGKHPKRDWDQVNGGIAVIDILSVDKDDNTLERLGAVTAVAILSDAENLVHPTGAEIFRKMSLKGSFSVVGILALSGSSFPEGPARDSLKKAFPGAYITVTSENELQSLRDSGDFSDIAGEIVELKTSKVENSRIDLSNNYSDGLLNFDDEYVGELSNNVERNKSLLNILQEESKGNGRIILYATTVENARFFAGLLPLQGVPASVVTAEDSLDARAIVLQRFISRDEKVLCVHGLLVSGKSVPDVSVCVMALPCKSREMFLSMIGRLVQGRDESLPPLRLIVAADCQADPAWVKSLNSWSSLKS